MGNKVSKESKVKFEIKMREFPEFTALEEYSGIFKKIKFKHNCQDCNYYIFESTPHQFFQAKYKCPKCAKHVKITTDDIIFKSKQKYYNRFKVLGEYESYMKTFPILCTACRRISYVDYNSFINKNFVCQCQKDNQERLHIYRSLKSHLDPRYLVYQNYYMKSHFFQQLSLTFDICIICEDQKLFIDYLPKTAFKDPKNKDILLETKNIFKSKKQFTKLNNIKYIQIPYNVNINSCLDKIIDTLSSKKLSQSTVSEIKTYIRELQKK